jgi:amino acid adenylation domain-containing protein/non-ribosomal peptide synthase protein (TIGR01720 family)
MKRHDLQDGSISDCGHKVDAVKTSAQRRIVSQEPPPSPGGVRLSKQPRKSYYHLSTPQLYIWLDHQLHPQSCSHNELFTLCIEGHIDVPVLQLCLQQIIRRNDAIRAVFTEKDRQPVQKIVENPVVPATLVDLTGLAEELHSACRAQLLKCELWRSFDLERGPLIRIRLIKLAGCRYELAVIVHHIVCDGMSFVILLRELAVIYQAMISGRPVPALSDGISYVDFAEWEWETLAATTERNRAVNPASRVEHAPPVLPGDFTPSDDARAEWEELSLSGALLKSLLRIAKGENTTPSNLLLAAFRVLLFKLTLEPQLTIGLVLANRGHAQVMSLIGLFADVSALQLPLEDDPGYREIVRAVTDKVFAICARQGDLTCPAHLEAGVPAYAGGRPTFRVAWSYQHGVPSSELPGGIRMQLGEPIAEMATPLDLRCLSVEMPDAINMRLVYRKTLFKRETIARLAQCWRILLEQIAESPGKRLSELTVLTEEDRRHLLSLSQGRSFHQDGSPFIHQQIADRASCSPDAIALTFEDQNLSYLQLAEQSAWLAQHLRDLGVGPEVCVGIYLERGLDVVIAILGVLRAGGAYVPLDPAYPSARIAYMLEDSQPSVLITSRQLSGRLPNTFAFVICLDDEMKPMHDEQHAPSNVMLDRDNLAYAIYTSGSSGKPKRVGISHKGLCNLAKAQREAFAISPDSSILQFSSMNFDAAVSEWITALSAGGRLVLASQHALLPGAELIELLKKEWITVVTLPPSILAVLPEHELPVLKTLVVAGEACSPDLIMRWSPGRRLVNAYGPTEDTVCASMSDPLRAGDIPVIGKPITNGRCLVLDPWMELNPMGIPGELYISGPGLARGYLGRPDLTAERFVPDPFSAAGGERLYRTGDRVRWRSDETLEFIGRMDEQVKIRGFRIEPAEIEAAILEHPGVRQAVVSVHRAKSGDVAGQRLVAYVLPAIEFQRNGSLELRSWLQARLPDYMVPGAFVFLNEIPLTPNGKTDRNALPDPEVVHDEKRNAPPATPTEEIIADIWAAVLGVDRVGRLESFFELGGHSLMATQAVSRVRSAFNLEMPLLTLFEFPTPAQFAEQVERARGQEHPLRLPPILPVSRTGELPLSFAQQRLWILQNVEPDNTAYNLPFAFRLRGKLDRAVLQRSINELVRRHEILRTSYPGPAGVPSQKIHRELNVVLPEVDLSSLARAEREKVAKSFVQQEAATRFDLAHLPIMRLMLISFGPEDSVLSVNMHHIVTDAWSGAIMLREISQLYESFSQHQASNLPELKIQYADFAAWQRETLQGAVLEQLMAYWSRQLDGLVTLDLPADRTPPVNPAQRGASVDLVIPAELAAQWKEFARKQSSTLYMCLLALFQVLLYRYTRQADIPVGSPIAGRTCPETEALIGCLVNTLVMRTQLAGNWTFTEMLQEVKRTALDAYRYQDMPFDRLVEFLNPERQFGRTPLFQVMFAWQNVEQRELCLQDISLGKFDFGSRNTVKFDLVLDLAEAETRIAGLLEYNTDVFDETTVARMAKHFRVLLEEVLKGGEQPLERIQLLSKEERRELVDEWNATEAAVPECCIHELFEQQSSARPWEIAIQHKQETMSYSGLDRRANQLGHYLLRLGAGPEVRVGIYMERSPEMIVALLGVLKAGAAYVPLDPAWPIQRTINILEDANIQIMLTNGSEIPTFVPSWVKVVPMRQEAERISQDEERLTCTATAENLAYLIYTSGSTGSPKGVALTHKNAVNLIEWGRDVFSTAERAGVLAGTSLAFDLSIYELWGTLCSGGKIFLVENPMDIASVSEPEKITLINTVPTVMSELLATQKVPASVRTINLAGETLSEPLLRRIFALTQVKQVNNLWGPTETTTYSTGTPLRGPEKEDPSIGAPILNNQVYVLDEALELCPVGVAGELYIGGLGVARGYWNRPEWTAERFIPDAVSGRPSERLFRSGDKGRWLDNGELQFIGRVDRQIKLRGHRIELEEIEAVLNRHGAVSEAVVTVQEQNGAKKLIAYVERMPGKEITNEELRVWLREQVPEYMVPSTLVIAEQLPRMSNGKLDRKRVAKLEAALECEQECEEPRTQLEKTLAAIWTEVLRQPHVGVNHNFFQLGGDSILSLQVISRAARMGLKLSARQLFQYQTIRQLGAVLETENTQPERQDLAEGEVRLTPIQHWFFEQDVGRREHFNQSVMLTGVGEEIDQKSLAEAIQQVAGWHDALRLRFYRRRDGQWEQRYAEGGEAVYSFSSLDLSQMGEQEQSTVIAEAATRLQQSLDLQHGPLFRAAYFQLRNGQNRLLLILHHLVVDGVSWRIFLEDLQQAYWQLRRHEKVTAPVRSSSYQRWAGLLEEYAQTEQLTRELKFWTREELGRAGGLKCDHHGPNTLKSEAMVTGGLSPDETQALLQLVPKAFTSRVEEALLAALAEALCAWTDGKTICIEMEGHGREHIVGEVDLSATLGWFTTLYPVLLRKTDGDVVQGLRYVTAQMRQMPRRGLGYGVLKYLSRHPEVKQKLRAQPGAEILFNYLGQWDQVLDPKTFIEAGEYQGPTRDPEGRRSHWIDISASVARGRLMVSWRFSRNLHQRASIEAMSGAFLASLRKLIALCLPDEQNTQIILTPKEWEAVLGKVGAFGS